MENKIRIVFFIGNLAVGGKERRLVELLTFLSDKKKFELLVVLTDNIISFKSFHQLDLSYVCIKKKWEKYDPTIFYQFHRICTNFKPHIIHSWGRVQSFYAIPASILKKIPLVNGQITSAPPKSTFKLAERLIDLINFKFSRIILSNSQAGIEAYNSPVNKSKVIYNGLDLNRFQNLPPIEAVKEKYKISTPLVVIMVASFSSRKNHDLFNNIARIIVKMRDDVTFIGVGGTGFKNSSFERLVEMNRDNSHIHFLDEIQDVEALVNACDIGVLFSNTENHGEGISNSIMEYMSLCKPVVANDAGGTKEIVCHERNGFLIDNPGEGEIRDLILELLNDKEKRQAFGRSGRKKIEKQFSIQAMGESFVKVYENIEQL